MYVQPRRTSSSTSRRETSTMSARYSSRHMLRRQRSFSTTTGRLNTSSSPFSSRNGIAQPPSLSKPSSESTRWPKNAYRRCSPSVTTSMPAVSCNRIAAMTSRSSSRLKSAALISPLSRCRRAASSAGGRSRLPTTSARMSEGKEDCLGFALEVDVEMQHVAVGPRDQCVATNRIDVTQAPIASVRVLLIREVHARRQMAQQAAGEDHYVQERCLAVPADWLAHGEVKRALLVGSAPSELVVMPRLENGIPHHVVGSVEDLTLDARRA